MPEEEKLFQPEQVEEQIERLTRAQSQQIPQSSDSRLISDLRQVYAEEQEIVEQVWAQLSAHAAQKRQASADGQTIQSRSRPNIPEGRLKGPQTMQKAVYEKRPRNTFIRMLQLSAAILVVATLVGGMVLLLHNVRQPTTGGLATPTVLGHPTTIVNTPTSVPAFTPTPAPTTTTNACNVAHPATLTPLTGTPDPALFYLTGKGGYQSGTSSTSLVRYDLTTGKKTTLVPAANDSSILDVKLSPDKQWLLFSTYTPFSTQGQTLITLRVIRTDGSLLQTLYSYCSGSYPGGTSILAWSPNEREVAGHSIHLLSTSFLGQQPRVACRAA